ncbi:MAG: type II toxin-antitoxin system VapC family toxin [Gammaproteobacteria bacterium]
MRAEAKGLLTEARSAEFLAVLREMSIVVDHATTAHASSETLQLARRFSLSSYDAAYLELALREGLPMATLDAQLRGAASAAGVAVAH